MSGSPNSMIGLCQEAKAPLTRFGGAPGTNSFWFLAACVGLSAAVPIRDRTRLPFAVLAHQGPHRRLSLCSPASPETNRREHREPVLLRPVGLTARPGRVRVEKSSNVLPAKLTRRSSNSLPLPQKDVAHDRPP